MKAALNAPHIAISQAAIIALITQIIAIVAGFGIIDSSQIGVIITAATAVVNAAFLVANSLHHVAASLAK